METTRAALHFANAAKRVTMQPKVNEVLNERALLRRMQGEIEGLRRQLVIPKAETCSESKTQNSTRQGKVMETRLQHSG